MVHITSKYVQIEKVTINDALPLKAARRDATANLKSFCGPGTTAT